MKDLIHLAITMTEIDTGIDLSLKERDEMFARLVKKIKKY
jgi:hypothetical protein